MEQPGSRVYCLVSLEGRGYGSQRETMKKLTESQTLCHGKERGSHKDDGEKHVTRNHLFSPNSCQPVYEEILWLRGNGKKEPTPFSSLSSCSP